VAVAVASSSNNKLNEYAGVDLLFGADSIIRMKVNKLNPKLKIRIPKSLLNN
jgi:hypothetical protein